MSADWRRDRIGSAERGENPMVLARLRSGFAVIGDVLRNNGFIQLDGPRRFRAAELFR